MTQNNNLKPYETYTKALFELDMANFVMDVLGKNYMTEPGLPREIDNKIELMRDTFEMVYLESYPEKQPHLINMILSEIDEQSPESLIEILHDYDVAEEWYSKFDKQQGISFDTFMQNNRDLASFLDTLKTAFKAHYNNFEQNIDTNLNEPKTFTERTANAYMEHVAYIIMSILDDRIEYNPSNHDTNPIYTEQIESFMKLYPYAPAEEQEKFFKYFTTEIEDCAMNRIIDILENHELIEEFMHMTQYDTPYELKQAEPELCKLLRNLERYYHKHKTA